MTGDGSQGMNENKPNWQRRALLAGGLLAVVGWVKGVPLLMSSGTPDLEFIALPDLAPFRRLVTSGATSSGATLLTGLAARAPLTPEEARLDLQVISDPRAAFFGPSRDGAVPIAMFSDFSCPNCRIMEARLKEMEASDPGSFRVVRHQLPILGVASTTASRAVLAADKQGAYLEMHERLIRTPAVSDLSYVTAIAADLGLDPARFNSDMTSGEIDQALSLTAAIARVFGFYGTPAFAVGRTVFLGAIPKQTLEALIAYEGLA